jgi:DNA-binding transcriptional LysR family regulator
MDLFQSMSVYVKVVEAGSMTKAALQCEMSTTMVGNHLRALEQRLGVQLLQRTTRRQRLTEFGSVYYQRCLEVLGLVADSERLAEQALDEPRGILRITAPLTFGVERLIPALSEFSLQYPQVKLDVVLTNRRPDLLESGLDVAFRLGNFEQSNLIARRLDRLHPDHVRLPGYTWPAVACRSPPQDLQQHDCLSFAYPAGDDWQSVEKEWRLSGPDGEVMVAVSGPMLINSSAGLHQAARTGMGIVMLPDALVEQDLREGKLVAVMPDYQPPSRPLHLLYAPDRYRLPKLRRFVEFAMQKWGRS